MQEDNSPKRSIGRGWPERVVFIAIVAVLGGWITFDRITNVPYTILVDGKPIVTLESLRSAKSALTRVRERQLGDKSPASVTFVQQVTFRRAGKGPEVSDGEDAAARLDGILTLRAQAYAIVVDGKPVIALVKGDDANRALDLLKQIYVKRTEHLYTKSTFKESVTVERRFIGVGEISPTPDQAAEYLSQVHGKPIYHTLKEGDRAVFLVSRYDTSLDDLKKLNPGIDLNRLTAGDRLLVSSPKTPITVVTKALTTTVTEVTIPAQRSMRARTGKRQVWSVATFENGVKVSEDVTRLVTTWNKPAPRTTKKHYSHTSAPD